MKTPQIRLGATWHTRGGHEYRITYSPGEEPKVIALLGVWACDPERDFDWDDAAGMEILVLQLHETLGPLLRQQASAGPKQEATPA